VVAALNALVHTERGWTCDAVLLAVAGIGVARGGPLPRPGPRPVARPAPVASMASRSEPA